MASAIHTANCHTRCSYNCISDAECVYLRRASFFAGACVPTYQQKSTRTFLATAFRHLPFFYMFPYVLQAIIVNCFWNDGRSLIIK